MIIAKHLQQGIGGIEIQCDLIARYFSRAGHQVVYTIPQNLHPDALAAYTLDACDLGDPAALEQHLDRHRPDIIYFRNNKYRLNRLASAARRRSIPLVFAASSLQDVTPWAFHHSKAPLSPRRLASIAWQRVKSRWNWRGFRHVSAAVSLNPDYTARIPVSPKITIGDVMESEREPFQWPRPYVLWVAQLKDYKQPELYVELARRCQDLDIDFLMIGGVANQRYRWIAERAGTPDNFHYLGERSPAVVNGALHGGIALVHTCLPEGFGNNFIQAWLQGRPTLSLQFDPAGIIERERLGSVPGDLPGLEAALRRLVADSDERATIGARAFQYARQHFDPQTNLAQLEQFLDTVLQHSGTPAA